MTMSEPDRQGERAEALIAQRQRDGVAEQDADDDALHGAEEGT